MPSFLVKESFCTDKTIASFSNFEFRLWVVLVLLADANGYGDARPDIVKGFGFPLYKKATASRIKSGMESLSLSGGIELYGEGEKIKYKISRFEELFPEFGRQTTQYAKWRKAVFQRDNYTCQECGKRGGKLNAHHIKRYRMNVEGRTDVNNGITLCEQCHRAVHHREGK